MTTIANLVNAALAGEPTRVSVNTSGRLFWPPDLYALAAHVLHHTGSYTRLLEDERATSERARTILNLAVTQRKRWRVQFSDLVARNQSRSPLVAAFYGAMTTKTVTPLGAMRPVSKWVPKSHTKPPLAITDALRTIYSKRHVRADLACDDNELVSALHTLLVYGDEFSTGFGLPQDFSNHFDIAWWLASTVLLTPRDQEAQASLCTDAIATVRVLPREHTPQCGMTLRSLSHNLSYIGSSEAKVNWWIGSTDKRLTVTERGPFNILLAPWPLTIRRSAFSKSNDSASHFGSFNYRPNAGQPSPKQWLSSKLDEIEKDIQHLNLIVFPELALSEEEFRDIVDLVDTRNNHRCGVMAGIHRDGRGSTNALFIKTSLFDAIQQRKHHRWKLDRSQVDTYGLASRLDPRKPWWESTNLTGRELNFFAVSEDLVITGLICEDLARQEPIAKIVRAVGPNLMIVALLDGPQLPHRWSARYASVFADDPGCSVLTLTSLGMVTLSSPPKGTAPSRAVALWKDPFNPIRLIEIPQDKEAAVITLSMDEAPEWTADSRRQDEEPCFPQLCSIAYY